MLPNVDPENKQKSTRWEMAKKGNEKWQFLQAEGENLQWKKNGDEKHAD